MYYLEKCIQPNSTYTIKSTLNIYRGQTDNAMDTSCYIQYPTATRFIRHSLISRANETTTSDTFIIPGKQCGAPEESRLEYGFSSGSKITFTAIIEILKGNPVDF